MRIEPHCLKCLSLGPAICTGVVAGVAGRGASACGSRTPDDKEEAVCSVPHLRFVYGAYVSYLGHLGCVCARYTVRDLAAVPASLLSAMASDSSSAPPSSSRTVIGSAIRGRRFLARLDIPIYCVRWVTPKPEEDTPLVALIGGGGGASKTGIRNKLLMVQYCPSKSGADDSPLEVLCELDCGCDIVWTMSVHEASRRVLCGSIGKIIVFSFDVAR